MGRNPTQKELVNSLNTVLYDGHTVKYVQKQLAATQEAHDDIANIGKSVLGYAPDEKWIQQEQIKLADYGVTQQNIRNDFVYSQAGHDAVVTMGSNILGRQMNDQQDSAWIKAQQDQEAAGMSLDQLRYNAAHGGLGDFAASAIMNTVLGRPTGDTDTAWVNSVKEQMSNGTTYQQILSNTAHGFLGDFAADQILYTLAGRYTNANDIVWKNSVKDQLAHGRTYASFI